MNQGLESTIKDRFTEVNKNFFIRHHLLLERRVCERTLCGALMLEINRALESSWYYDYFADMEYNCDGDMVKLLPKKLFYDDTMEKEQLRIFPDIVVHSRGRREPDNLLVIEMKKADAKEAWKDTDRNRLMAMTEQDGPFAYRLGIFYIVDFLNEQVQMEYYVNGECVEQDSTQFVKA